jgi:hypothetical protein
LLGVRCTITSEVLIRECNARQAEPARQHIPRPSLGTRLVSSRWCYKNTMIPQQLPDLTLLRPDGSPVLLSQLLTQDRTLLLFVRHFA